MGRTPLHYAAATGNVELVSLLLQWHANSSVVDKVSDSVL
jgi:ankyrin repeat protein